MHFHQYYLGCLSHASYMIGDTASGKAVVVDPQRDIEQYLADAKQQGFTISHVILTHFHADFVAGHLELAKATGATIALGRRGGASYPHRALKEGDIIDLGPDVSLHVLETPGHTPEGISLLVYDHRKTSEKPHAVLTGDTLFIGDVGRPDLLASVGVTADELADMLYDSVHNKLAKLPDETMVYPAHGAGSMCGKNLSKETFSTIGHQKQFNYAMKPMDRETFKAIVTADQPAAPGYFVYNATLNKQSRETLDASMSRGMTELSLDDFLKMQAAGVMVLDTRHQIEFSQGHLRGAVNIGLDGKFATWAGTLLKHDQPVILIADEGKEHETVMRLGRIGYDDVRGYLKGGMASLLARQDLLVSSRRIDATDLANNLSAGMTEPVRIIDIRTKGEWEAGHIDGAVHIPVEQLPAHAAELADGKRTVLYCGSGYRTSAATSLLALKGVQDVIDVIGGWGAIARTPLGKGAKVSACGTTLVPAAGGEGACSV